MTFYLVAVTELPYPHAMGERPHPDGTASNCPMALQRLRSAYRYQPGQVDYREILADAAMAERRKACDVHEGDWGIVLPAVTAFLEPYPADADPIAIYHARREHPGINDLATADRMLAQALLNTLDPIKYFLNGHGELESSAQHRICWARTAGVPAVPAWFDQNAAAPPSAAVLLQRG